MADNAREMIRPTDPVGRILFPVTRALAIFGGALCCFVAIMVVVSVTGRYLFAAPIPGDYDIVGIMCGTAVFAFLPFCQLVRGNVVVDFFTSAAPPRIKAVLDAAGSLLYLAAAVLFTWRLYHGAVDLYLDREVIAAFTFYRWWTLPFDLVCMVLLIIVIAYTLSHDLSSFLGGRSTSQPASGQE